MSKRIEGLTPNFPEQFHKVEIVIEFRPHNHGVNQKTD